ncbi:MAG: hypothetical protein ACREAB_12490 [Blastocatellia bacterium]
MAKNRNKKKNLSAQRTGSEATAQGIRRWLAPVAIVGMLMAAAVIFYYGNSSKRKAPEPINMTVAQAVMVTVELDFGGAPPTITQAIQQIERGYAPDDGVGRTFAILDAYGEPTADGKKLHMSMHVSSEKPGTGTLKFKRTGEILWRARIGNPGDAPAGQKNLMIYLSKGTGDGTNHVLDGARGGDSALNVYLQNSQQRARDVWPDGAERELTFIYSACGCPVKVMCRRVGERTVRTKDVPVIFPDDPAVVSTISNLMKW